ncbi:Ig-like domain-containing protein [Cellulophaga sp. F20128]|uniref:Ig-like domain-containing protein n=1 Tax=Cellulophaga sp. F20128 TaxID=2926413 RepID=UPI001FF160AC|nr:Ig-like domain-containing protein [Cellulophaga sp. F20128]MCK0157442.1 Ig-like domain-containing protein [Cellulophaga sp. F20128]
MARRILGFVFLVLMVFALLQCARRGTPSGGEKDVTPPVLLKAEPANKTVNFKSPTIRLYFDEYIKLKDVQKQLIISPPLKNQPEITPQGSASKYIEIKIKDTLRENTTYTFNFGQSIEDNNEGNPSSFLSYVFSTGDYLDSLSITGVVNDAYKKEVDNFVSVMLYEVDSSYTDSTIYKQPPLYITNTLDSTAIFSLKNLKKGKYALFALKDEGSNYKFDQNIDRIGFLGYTITIPTDSIFVLDLFKEVPEFIASVPSYAAKNKIIFGYQGDGSDLTIERLTPLPDSVKTIVSKELEKDTLNYWISPFTADSLIFRVVNDVKRTIDTFTVKSRKLPLDSLRISATQNKSISLENPFWVSANIPIKKIDTSKITILDKDTISVAVITALDSVKNRLNFNLVVPAENQYRVRLLPSAITDFFGNVNDTIVFGLSPVDPVEHGVLNVTLTGAVTYPVIVQILNESNDKIVREEFAATEKVFVFKNLKPSNYQIRVIEDHNGNKKWDTGSYLQKKFPEKVNYAPNSIEIRANWEEKYEFEIIK